MGPTQGSAARATVLKTAIWVSSVSAAVVILGGTVAWLLERHVPGAHSARGATPSGGPSPRSDTATMCRSRRRARLVAAVVMIAGVAVLGGVAAGVALIVARAVAVAQEQSLEVEAESLERRLEERLSGLEARLARIEGNFSHSNVRTPRPLSRRSRSDGGLRSDSTVAGAGICAHR